AAVLLHIGNELPHLLADPFNLEFNGHLLLGRVFEFRPSGMTIAAQTGVVQDEQARHDCQGHKTEFLAHGAKPLSHNELVNDEIPSLGGLVPRLESYSLRKEADLGKFYPFFRGPTVRVTGWPWKCSFDFRSNPLSRGRYSNDPLPNGSLMSLSLFGPS